MRTCLASSCPRHRPGCPPDRHPVIISIASRPLPELSQQLEAAVHRAAILCTADHSNDRRWIDEDDKAIIVIAKSEFRTPSASVGLRQRSVPCENGENWIEKISRRIGIHVTNITYGATPHCTNGNGQLQSRVILFSRTYTWLHVMQL